MCQCGDCYTGTLLESGRPFAPNGQQSLTRGPRGRTAVRHQSGRRDDPAAGTKTFMRLSLFATTIALIGFFVSRLLATFDQQITRRTAAPLEDLFSSWMKRQKKISKKFTQKSCFLTGSMILIPFMVWLDCYLVLIQNVMPNLFFTTVFSLFLEQQKKVRCGLKENEWETERKQTKRLTTKRNKRTKRCNK